jgi:hypothetical protein
MKFEHVDQEDLGTKADTFISTRQNQENKDLPNCRLQTYCRSVSCPDEVQFQTSHMSRAKRIPLLPS